MRDEIELKLRSSPATLRRLANSRHVKAFKAGKARTRRLVSTYFDTPRHALRRAGIALRVRRDGDRYEQTVKAPVAGPAGLHRFREWSGPVPANEPCLDAIDDPDLRSILARGGRHRRLQPVFTTDVERRALPLRLDGARVELAVDVGRIQAENGAGEDVSELELELERGEAAEMLDLALALIEEADLTVGYRSKAERGYALVSPALRRGPVGASPSPLRADMTVEEAFYAIIDAALGHLRANESRVAAGRADGVHQARVAIRRLRAALRAFKQVLPYDKRKAFNGEFRWFQQRLSPARDWHVFVTETLPAVHAAFPGSGPALARLRRQARAERARAVREVADLFGTRRYARLILQFARWLAVPAEVLDPSVARRPARAFAAGVLEATHREFLADDRPLSRMPPEDLHALRKRGKKSRYANEFFAGLWAKPGDGSGTEAYLLQMKEIQDALGVTNDASVAPRLVSLLRPGRLDPEAARRVQEWSSRRLAECLREAQPKWLRFKRSEPFWR